MTPEPVPRMNYPFVSGIVSRQERTDAFGGMPRASFPFKHDSSDATLPGAFAGSHARLITWVSVVGI